MVKVLMVITKDDVGGAQRYVRDLAENLDKARFETKIITGGKKPMLDVGSETLGARYLSNNFRPHFLFFNDLAAAIELFFIFRREHPDIIHLNSSKAGVVGAFAAWLYNASCIMRQASRTTVIFTAHGWVFNPDNNLSGLRRQFYILLHRFAAKFQDAIINVSEYDRQLAVKEKIAPLEKLVTVRNGVDFGGMKFLDKMTARSFLAGLLKLKTSAYRQAGKTLKLDGLWIGSIGRLVSEKSYEDFIKAATLVKNLKANFFIFGDGYERQKLQSLLARHQLQDRFFLLGAVVDAARHLKALDVFVLSSVKEGLPYTMLEAMAASLPMITTRVGGMTEIVEGRGLVMPPREPEELARAIDHYLDHPQEAEKLAMAARKYLKENLTLEKMVKKTERVYLCA